MDASNLPYIQETPDLAPGRVRAALSIRIHVLGSLRQDDERYHAQKRRSGYHATKLVRKILPSLASRTIASSIFRRSKWILALSSTLDSQIEPKELLHFIDQVDLLSRIVTDELGLKDFSRIGMRVWYLFRCQDKEESERWLGNLELFSLSRKDLRAP